MKRISQGFTVIELIITVSSFAPAIFVTVTVCEAELFLWTITSDEDNE